MDLKSVHEGVHRRRRKKRVGRGPGSKTGRTATRGSKGQYSHTGTWPLLLKEGGQMPLFRRVPKRGFNNAEFRDDYMVVNVVDLDDFDDGEVITPEVLFEHGLIKRLVGRVKVLGDGEFRRKLEVRAHSFSQSARQKIEGAGGACHVLPTPRRGPKVRGKMRPRKPRQPQGT
jgi:large subunit ribosomal protein L15